MYFASYILLSSYMCSYLVPRMLRSSAVKSTRCECHRHESAALMKFVDDDDVSDFFTLLQQLTITHKRSKKGYRGCQHTPPPRCSIQNKFGQFARLTCCSYTYIALYYTIFTWNNSVISWNADPLSSDRQHLSYDGCLEVKGEDY